MEDYKEIYKRLISQVEHEVIEYKTAENQYDTNKLGKYFSALSNEANLRDLDFAWILMGINNNRQVVGTHYLTDPTNRQYYLSNCCSKDPSGARIYKTKRFK